MGAQQSHREGRTIHDADSHIIEHPGWLESYASDYVKANLLPGLIPLDSEVLQPVIKMANDRLDGNNPRIHREVKS